MQRKETARVFNLCAQQEVQGEILKYVISCSIPAAAVRNKVVLFNLINYTMTLLPLTR